MEIIQGIIAFAQIVLVIYMFKIKKSIDTEYAKKLENHKNELQKDFEDYKSQKLNDLKTYSELINLTRVFLQDPNLKYKDAKKMAESFIVKYNNEILPFASNELVESVDEFLYNSATKIAEENELTLSLWKMIWSIRSELDLKPLNKITFHVVDDESIKEHYVNNI